MVRKAPRLFMFVLACSAVGVILGGTASQAEINQCQAADTPSSECLTQDPMFKTLEGMSVWLVAGAGAALGATFDIWKKKM